ncbi:MAG TPA: hypothetical protein VMT34_03455 [Aggregatilineales bacterium]|nr:hypothetical protein [Aggregatilineales bacterium]
MSSAKESTASTPSQSAKARQSARARLKADQNGVLTAAAILAGVGWVGLYFLIDGSKPLAFPRWLFFILLFIAVTGTAIPFSWFLNRRFTKSPVSGGIILRQGIWFGLFAVIAAWLQIPRTLNGAIAFFLALSLVVIETFLRLRERAGRN